MRLDKPIPIVSGFFARVFLRGRTGLLRAELRESGERDAISPPFGLPSRRAPRSGHQITQGFEIACLLFLPH